MAFQLAGSYCHPMSTARVPLSELPYAGIPLSKLLNWITPLHALKQRICYVDFYAPAKECNSVFQSLVSRTKIRKEINLSTFYSTSELMMGSREWNWVLETDPTTSSSSMRLPPEQSEKSRHALSGTTSYVSSQHPSPCVSCSSKIPIPRLLDCNEVAVRPRAKKTYKECRDLKTKCDGYQPCGRCMRFKIDCIYVNRKKAYQERYILTVIVLNNINWLSDPRRLQDLERPIQNYKKLLRQLQLKEMLENKTLIAQALAEVHYPSMDYF